MRIERVSGDVEKLDFVEDQDRGGMITGGYFCESYVLKMPGEMEGFHLNRAADLWFRR